VKRRPRYAIEKDLYSVQEKTQQHNEAVVK
jgi:hypothetical protein